MSWHGIRCRGTGCARCTVLSVHDITADVDTLLRRAMATLLWYPVSTCDWLCPDCGPLTRRDVRESAITLRIALERALVVRRAP